MAYTERLSEMLSVVATVDPDAYGTGTQQSDIIDMSLHRRVMFIVSAGTLGSSATIDFNVHGSASSNMASSALITGKSITQLTEAGTDDDKLAILEVTSEEVAAQGFRYIRGNLIVLVDTSDCGMVALADYTRYSPAADYDLSSVDEIVA